MADCRIVNASVINAVDEIATISSSYKTAGEEFVAALKSAISAMEGDTKDALLKFFEGDVNEFVAVSIPGAVDGMSKLLEENRKNFEKIDNDIAQNIGGGGG